MKLPFKIPKLPKFSLPKFGKKKRDDDDGEAPAGGAVDDDGRTDDDREENEGRHPAATAEGDGDEPAPVSEDVDEERYYRDEDAEDDEDAPRTSLLARLRADKRLLAIAAGSLLGGLLVLGGLGWWLAGGGGHGPSGDAGSKAGTGAVKAGTFREGSIATMDLTSAISRPRSGPSLNQLMKGEPAGPAKPAAAGGDGPGMLTPPKPGSQTGPATNHEGAGAKTAEPPATGETGKPATGEKGKPAAGEAGKPLTGEAGKPAAGADSVVVMAVSVDAFAGVKAGRPAGPLAPAPDPELSEQKSGGRLLPKIGAGGREPRKVYARPFTGGGGRIALVVAGLGLSEAATSAAIDILPAAVTLAFDAEGTNVEAWIKRARAAGHEVLLNLALESEGFPLRDPGPEALSTTAEDGENRARLEGVMGRAVGYVGLINVGGTKFSQSGKHMAWLMGELKGRGLLYVDASGTPKTVAPNAAADSGAALVVNDLFIDRIPSRVAIEGRLVQLEGLARKVGAVLGVARPLPASITRIAAWAATLQGKGLALAPVSAIPDGRKKPGTP